MNGRRRSEPAVTIPREHLEMFARIELQERIDKALERPSPKALRAIAVRFEAMAREMEG